MQHLFFPGAPYKIWQLKDWIRKWDGLRPFHTWLEKVHFVKSLFWSWLCILYTHVLAISRKKHLGYIKSQRYQRLTLWRFPEFYSNQLYKTNCIFISYSKINIFTFTYKGHIILTYDIHSFFPEKKITNIPRCVFIPASFELRDGKGVTSSRVHAVHADPFCDQRSQWFLSHLFELVRQCHPTKNTIKQIKINYDILTRVAELLDLLSTIYLFVVVPRSLTETTCCLSMVSDVTTPAMNGDLPCDIWCRWAKIKETMHAKIERNYTRKITLHMSTGSWTLQQ